MKQLYRLMFGFWLLLASPLIANSQSATLKLSTAQLALLDTLALDGTVMGRYVSRIAYCSDQWRRADSLSRISSTDELVYLTSLPSPAVKVYAFLALLDRKEWEPALRATLNNRDDRQAFVHMFGCIGGVSEVSSFMVIRLHLSLKDNRVSLPEWAQKELATAYAEAQTRRASQLAKPLLTSEEVELILDRHDELEFN